MIKETHIIILAGGEGRRIWPLGTKEKPKQLIKFDSAKSSFQKTVLRAQKISNQPPTIVTTKNLVQETLKQLQEINCDNYILLIEPKPCNTAYAAVAAVNFIIQKQKIVNFLLMPSDHEITNDNEFCLEMQEHLQNLNYNKVNIFGNFEKHVSSKFGYFYFENPKLHFIEKPTQEIWSELALKKPLRNSGMIASNAKIFLNEINSQHKTKFLQIQQNQYEISSSIDFANQPIDKILLENCSKLNGIKLRNEVSDIGSFEELMKNFANANQLKIAKNEANLTDVRFIKDGFEFLIDDHNVIIKKHFKPLKN